MSHILVQIDCPVFVGLHSKFPLNHHSVPHCWNIGYTAFGCSLYLQVMLLGPVSMFEDSPNMFLSFCFMSLKVRLVIVALANCS